MESLEEKFYNILPMLDDEGDVEKEIAKNCAKLAESEMIKFAKWFAKNHFIIVGVNEYWSSDFDGRYTMKELLELYKQHLKTKDNGK